MSVKMAKEQSLSLNPSKLAGHVRAAQVLPALRVPDATSSSAARCPRSTRVVESVKGNGVVTRHNVLQQTVHRSAAARTARWSRRRSTIWSRRAPRPEPRRRSVLPHDAALLRQRGAAPRPHLHAVVADTLARFWRARGRDVFVAHRHRRARRQDRAGRGAQPASTPKAYADRDQRRSSARRGSEAGLRYDHFIRTTDAHHVAFVRKVLADIHAARRHLLRQLPRPLLLRLRALLPGARAGRRPLPRPPDARPTEIAEENYFFRMAQYQERLAGTSKTRPDLIDARRLSQRGPGAAPRADRRPLHLAAEERARRGASSCRSTTATSPTSGSTRCSTT